MKPAKKRGRAPLPEKERKQQLSLFLPKYLIDHYGGAVKLRHTITQHLTTQHNDNNQRTGYYRAD